MTRSFPVPRQENKTLTGGTLPTIHAAFLVLHLILWSVLSGCRPDKPSSATTTPPSYPQASAPTQQALLNHEVYVWQSSGDTSVQQAIRDQASHFSKLLLLVTELSWPSSKPQVRRIRLDAPTLNATGKDWGAVFRIGHHRSLHTPGSESSKLVFKEFQDLVAQCTKLTHPPSEYQIDYDCPERLLGDYAPWLVEFRKHIPSHCKLTITGLPSWLDRAELPKLLRYCDSYILQVHTLSAPGFQDAQPKLCDPDKAQRWVARADKLGKPFRIALPTYSYLAAYQPNGVFLGVSAENPSAAWPPESILRRIDSSPQDLARLIAIWSQKPPRQLQGILWFRLPVASDSLNWSAETLHSVMVGEVPHPAVQSFVICSEPGLYEIGVTNAGTCSATYPARIRIQGPWAEQLIGSDSLPPYAAEQTTANIIDLVLRPSRRLLNPHESEIIGWVRLVSQETSTTVLKTEISQLP